MLHNALYFNMWHQQRGDDLNIKHGVEQNMQQRLKLQGDFSQEVQGRGVDEALFRDFSEFRFDE